MTARAIRAQTHHFHGVEPESGLGDVEASGLGAVFTTVEAQSVLSILELLKVNVFPSALNVAVTVFPISTPVVNVMEYVVPVPVYVRIGVAVED